MLDGSDPIDVMGLLAVVKMKGYQKWSKKKNWILAVM